MIDRKLRTALLAGLAVCGMTGLGYASVPLYRIFCEATGLNGTTNRAKQAPGAVNATMRVDFDANVNPKLPWSFAPEQRSMTVRLGERQMAFFTATNNSDHEITGSASYNVTPDESGRYFSKIQCFCFSQQTLKPHETVRMPVIFFVDPAMLKDSDATDVKAITLSYTFYSVDSAKAGG